jgi:dipeptidyl aminopeptidase/acylaminoacyl peptidase
MKTFRLLLALAFLLAGCATPTPDATITESKATQPAPAIAATAMQQPPTATEAIPTSIPATSTPDAGQQEQASILPLVAPCNFADQAISYSPNKTWVMVNCQGDQPENGTTTKFARMDGSQSWSLSFNEVYLKPYRANDLNLNALLPKAFIPVRWTKNEDFVYLAVQTNATGNPYAGYDGLFRLDLSTGKSRPVLKPATAPLSTTYAFKFSPNGNKLAYINQAVKPVAITIIDTGNGGENKITLDNKFSQGGNLVWSANEQKLIVSALDSGKNGGNSVILYDLETMKNEYVLQQSTTTYLPLEWIDTNTIYAESYPGSWVYIDLGTGATSAAPAPTPVP